MLLSSDAVTYCQIVRHRGEDTEVIPGVAYHGNLFVRGHSFPKTQKDIAIAEMRSKYLDPEPPIACLLIELPESVTIWHEDRQVIRAVSSTEDIVKYTNIPDLVKAMQSHPGGLTLKDRAMSFRLRTYRQCFIGKEGVNWLVTHLTLSRPESVVLGQRAIDSGWMVNALEGKTFGDDDGFYQFSQPKPI
jgi:hypothetical protein